MTTCLLAVMGKAGKSRRGCIEVPGKLAGGTCLTTLSSTRLLHLGVVAEYFHLAPCCSCCNCQTSNDAVGGFACARIDDAHMAVVNCLFACTIAVKDDDYLVRGMEISIDKLVDQELACSGQILPSQSLKRSVSFDYIVAIDQDIASHCVCYPF